MRVGPDGVVVPVDKPIGPTSHDVVARARRSWGIRKIGHTGTLDPFASGLLLLCVGRATRIAEYLVGLDKGYVGTALLGVATTTDDLRGEPTASSEAWRELAPSRIREALEAFQGEIEQIPPQYSAKKVGGESMHRRARRGETVALKPSTVRVRELEVLEIEPPRVRFRVECSSGTYIRALARDLGMALGVGGHLVELRRTRIGSFRADCALSVDDLDDARKVADASIPTLSALGHLPSWTAGADEVSDLVEGRGVRVTEVVTGPGREGPVVAAAGGRVLAIGAVSEGCFRPSKVFR